MKHIELKNTHLLQIKHRNTLYYGGSQVFYKQMIKRWSGCGPTTAANQLAYIGTTQPSLENLFPNEEISRDNILPLMENVWKYITPDMHGVSQIETLAKGGVAYGKSVNVPLTANSLAVSPEFSLPTHDEACSWLEQQLENNLPVAFLSLNSGQVKNLSPWHWTLIVGIDYDETSLFATIYDEGARKQVNLKLWLETTNLDGGFVSFQGA